MLIICVTFTVYDAHIESFREAILANASTSLKEENGCLRFDVCQSKDGATFFFYEQYVDDQAFDVHLLSPHFLEFDRFSVPLVKDKKVERYYLVEQSACVTSS
ncbi:putative quinol monooxygenase [Cupriavidus necator]|nr:putative quinol monooxygenase [Cupriavidus necator]MDX6007428.1 putative quinol monooxygenase [Cupriavidus necator]